MPQLTGTTQIFHGDTSAVDTSQLTELGRRSWDSTGNEYVYLQGTASIVAGDWVVYDENYGTTRLITGETGPVAVAMAAVTTDRFGWFQTYGVNNIARTDTVSADSSLYIDATTGRVDDAGIAGDIVLNAYSMTADSGGTATVSLLYPSVTQEFDALSINSETPVGTVDGVNITFTVDNTPVFVVADSMVRVSGFGYSFAGGTITMDIAPFQYIRSFY